MDMSAHLQLDKICRACLTEKSDMMPLYGACLDEMLNSFIFVQVKHDDGLPSQLCEKCALQCNNAYTFKQLCQKSDRILRESIKPELQNLVTSIHIKVEVDEANELDQYAEKAHDLVKHEIKSEIDFCTDSDAELDQNSEPLQLLVRMEALRAAKPPPAVSGQCGAIFALEPDLSAHPKEYTHICAVCTKAFATAKKLQRHEKIHLDRRRYECDQCEKSFPDTANLIRHKKSHTGESRNIVGSPYLCSVCGKAYRWASGLKKHMRQGHSLHVCNYCSLQFGDMKSLKIHGRMHTGERPYLCNICQETFTQGCYLKNHIRMHNGEKPFLCSVCGRSFTQSCTLEAHKRMHADIKSHICDVCEKGFYSRSSLSGHMKTHTVEKHHECNECGNKYSSVNGLKLHMKSHLEKKEEQKHHFELNVVMEEDETQFLEDKREPLQI